jgi:hypothetical protein
MDLLLLKPSDILIKCQNCEIIGTAVYTPPPDEGIAEASSAIEAAISQ